MDNSKEFRIRSEEGFFQLKIFRNIFKSRIEFSY